MAVFDSLASTQCYQPEPATQCYPSEETETQPAAVSSFTESKPAAPVRQDTVPYDAATQPYVPDTSPGLGATVRTSRADDTVPYDCATQAMEMPPPRFVPKKKARVLPKVEFPREDLPETQVYMPPAAGNCQASHAAPKPFVPGASVLDVPDSDSEGESWVKPGGKKRTTISPRCRTKGRSALRTPTKTSAPAKRSAAAKASTVPVPASARKQTSPGVDCSSGLPDAAKVLRYSGKPASSDYITQRCKKLSGRTVQYALEKFKCKDYEGQLRGYRPQDLRYDLKSGRLTVA
eukprot:TRINITY_DN17509_c0_g1_i1.p1 TRINITY_DN17509_c0_g1~~TRINITY_DN17509_c0_g1_i1.p1  ORF type:complete len:317 (+),score=49.46 TRINITY_DN17509_c0_g1_i1:80-952(+)